MNDDFTTKLAKAACESLKDALNQQGIEVVAVGIGVVDGDKPSLIVYTPMVRRANVFLSRYSNYWLKHKCRAVRMSQVRIVLGSC